MPVSQRPLSATFLASLALASCQGHQEAVVREDSLPVQNATDLGPGDGTLLRGTYRVDGRRATFTECGADRPLPVAPMNDAIDLYWAWSETHTQPGQPLTAIVRAEVRPLPAGGSSREPRLVVQEFIGLDPGREC